MLELTENHFIAKGSHNLVYRHPSNTDLLVKVLGIVKVLGLTNAGGVVKGLDHRFQNSKWLGNMKLVRSMNRFRLRKAHLREFMELLRIRFHDEFLIQPPSFLQEIHGFVDTNYGFAMIVKAEKDREGNYAPTLTTLIKQNKMDDQVKKKLDECYHQLMTYDFIFSDLHPDNLVYAYNEKLKADHFVLIDGIGDKTIVPILRWSRYLRDIKKARSIRKLNHMLTEVEQS
jgi:hypothetical protein